jgi:hypothetical protein
MTWRGFPSLLVCALLGCAAPAPRAETQSPVIYQDSPSAALAYAPPAVAQSAPGAEIDLSRAGRGTVAFVGFPSLVTEYFWLRTDDRQRFYSGNGGGGRWGGGGWSNDRYERRAVSTRVGVLHR